MPQAPYAKLRASINGGAVTTGGITVSPSATVQLTADPSASVGASVYKYEIYGYPIGFTAPAGWSTDSSGIYYYNGGSVPPVFTLPTIANWGKFMLRLTLDNGVSTNSRVIPPTQLIDESTALSMLSQNGLADVGALESNQFNKTWVTPVQASLRSIDTAVTSVAGANQKPPATLLGASNIASLSGEQTIDGVLTSASRVLLISQTTSSQNGLWLTSSGAWSRPTDFNTDAQVLVGQTVFVTSGSVNAGTNWQLTSGSTIAGAKTYSQLVGGGSGSTVLQPVDAVATSNNSLSGTTAVDGVTLTASTSRVLAVNQTTSSQNGLWLVQSGAWTRPLDFAVDSQVVSGLSVYVKPGGLSGGGSTWQLQTGSTIAGAKTWKRLPGAIHAPVRLMQTAALPSYTYNAGTQLYTQTGNAPFATTVFDGIIPSVGDDVALVLEGIRNGFARVIQLGDGSTQPNILQRRSDLSSSSDFVNGVVFDVLDGSSALGSYKGTRWQLSTLGTITIDTTSTKWIQMVPKGYIEVDLNAPPYNILTAADAGIVLNSFFDHCEATGVPQIGKLPRGTMNWDTPADIGQGMGLIGCGVGVTNFVTNASKGGPALFTRGVNNPITFHNGTIDTAATSTPVVMYDASIVTSASFIQPSVGSTVTVTVPNTSGMSGAVFVEIGGDYTVTSITDATHVVLQNSGGSRNAPPGTGIPIALGTDHPWLDLSLAGLKFDNGYLLQQESTGWANFEMTMNLEMLAMNSSGGSARNIIRCSGRRSSNEPSDILLSVQNIAGTNNLRAILRLEDLTSGVYGSVTQTGTGTTVVTGDGSVPPTDDFNIAFRCTNGGTIGTPGITFQYTTNALDPCPVWEPGPDFTESAQSIVLGSAISYTIIRRSSPKFTAKFNFSAGTWVKGDTFSCATSGVRSTYVLDQAIAGTGKYELTLQYDGSTISWYASPLGGARATPTTLSAHGWVKQKPWENCVIGLANNSSLEEALVDVTPAAFAFGAIRFRNSGITTPPSTTPTTINASATGTQFTFRPASNLQLLAADGVTVKAWQAVLFTFSTWVIPRRSKLLKFPTGIRLRDFTIDRGVSRWGGGMILVAPVSSQFGPLGFAGGNYGLRVIGPSFFAGFRDLNFGTIRYKPLVTCNCGLNLTGNNSIGAGGEMMLTMTDAGLNLKGSLFFNLEDNTRHCMTFNQFSDTDADGIIVDDENVQGAPYPRHLVYLTVGQGSVTLGGLIGTGLSPIPIALATSFGKLVCSGKLQLRTGGPCAIEVRYAGAHIIECGPGFDAANSSAGPAPLCNVDGVVRSYRGTLPPIVLTGSSQTITMKEDGGACIMREGVASGSPVITVTGIGVGHGKTMRFRIEKQTVDVVIASGGYVPVGGSATLVTVHAGGPDSFGVRRNSDGTLVVVPV